MPMVFTLNTLMKTSARIVNVYILYTWTYIIFIRIPCGMGKHVKHLFLYRVLSSVPYKLWVTELQQISSSRRIITVSTYYRRILIFYVRYPLSKLSFHTYIHILVHSYIHIQYHVRTHTHT